ncbi:hypothetical protein AVEN_115862-1 [Araneus ventricosus]|uniref:Uncharacterized protein n=1 Tax=Araneus ventricosus TaxID=182803 RepID=A0A4Y2K517_ARAVE|nr:hypothetical protein AVEN_115862-1 [Araneus ventricosus]
MFCKKNCSICVIAMPTNRSWGVDRRSVLINFSSPAATIIGRVRKFLRAVDLHSIIQNNGRGTNKERKLFAVFPLTQIPTKPIFPSPFSRNGANPNIGATGSCLGRPQRT